MNDFDETVLEYYRQSNKPFNRFLSWEHCYEYFYINKENIDYDAMYCEEMMRRLAKKGFKLESYGDSGNGRVRLNFTKGG